MGLTDDEKLRRAVEDGEFAGDVGPLLVAEIRRLRDANRRLNRRCQATEHFAAAFRRESENLRGLGHFVAWYQRMVAETRRRVERCCRDFERGGMSPPPAVNPPNEPSLDRLVMDPDVSATSPCVRGTFTTVDQIVSLMLDGWTWADIRRSRPELTEDDIRACLEYAARGDVATPED